MHHNIITGNMKKISITLLALLHLHTVSAQDFRHNMPLSTGIAYNSVCYAGNGTLFIAGDSGSLLKSVNGGESFFKLNPPAGGELRSISFHDPDTGYLCGENNLIMRTVDGGGNWEVKSTYLFTYTSAVFAMAQNSVYAVGMREGCLPPGGTNPCGEIMKSPNGGSSWNLEFYGTLDNLNSVYFPSPDTGYVVGGYSTLCAYNGSGWLRLVCNPLSSLNSVHSPHAGTAYAVGLEGNIWKTSDSGNSWDTLSTGLPGRALETVWFTSELTGYVAGESGSIMKTTNGGSTWTALNTGSTEWILSMVFSDPDTGFAVGTHETILRTTNAGLTWNTVTVGNGYERSVREKLRIVPTPATDFIKVEFPDSYPEGTVTLFSLTGTALLRQTLTPGNSTMDISSLTKGIYLLQFMNSKTMLTGKVVKD
jgi:photosystem II stability/assembly factor-like uncharacterized protein